MGWVGLVWEKGFLGVLDRWLAALGILARGRLFGFRRWMSGIIVCAVALCTLYFYVVFYVTACWW